MSLRVFRVLVALALLAVVGVTSGRAAEEAPIPGRDKPISIRLDPLVVSIQRNGIVEKHIGFVIVLEVGNSAAQAKVQDLMPKLNDAFVTDINALASLPHAADNGIDPDALKRRLTASCTRVLGADVVKSIVFLRSFTRKVS